MNNLSSETPAALEQSPNETGKQQWRLEEDLDGCYVYPANRNPDDYCFHRVNAVAKIADSDEALKLVKYLSKLPAFRGRREKRISRAMKLHREHIHQSNQDAVKSGSYIKGYNPKIV